MRRRRNGAAAVEMAVVLPVLLMIALGAIEYGRAMHLLQMATSASCAGARVLAQTGDETKADEIIEDYLAGDQALGTTGKFVSNDIDTYTVKYNVTGKVCSATVEINYDAEAYCPRLTYVGGETVRATSAYRMEREPLDKVR